MKVIFGCDWADGRTVVERHPVVSHVGRIQRVYKCVTYRAFGACGLEFSDTVKKVVIGAV